MELRCDDDRLDLEIRCDVVDGPDIVTAIGTIPLLIMRCLEGIIVDIDEGIILQR